MHSMVIFFLNYVYIVVMFKCLYVVIQGGDPVFYVLCFLRNLSRLLGIIHSVFILAA